MISLVRKTLETYLKEKRMPLHSEFSSEEIALASLKEALFITVYHNGSVIASAGRIQCKKENTLAECLDLSLQLLVDSRFSAGLQDPNKLSEIRVRVDRITPSSRRMLKNIDDLNVRNEGIIFLSQNYGVMSVILPQMIEEATPEKYFEGACQKAGVESQKMTNKDYVIYGLSTLQENDF